MMYFIIHWFKIIYRNLFCKNENSITFFQLKLRKHHTEIRKCEILA